MSVLPLIAAGWALSVFVAWALCAAAGRSDRRIKGWRNRETP